MALQGGAHRVRPSEKITLRVIPGLSPLGNPRRRYHPSEGRALHAREEGSGFTDERSPLGYPPRHPTPWKGPGHWFRKDMPQHAYGLPRLRREGHACGRRASSYPRGLRLKIAYLRLAFPLRTRLLNVGKATLHLAVTWEILKQREGP